MIVTIRTGRVLKDRYELTDRIALGGMGEVWRAHDRTLDRTVAIKVLRDDLRGNETALARLRAEARNGGGVSHPNVATLLDYGEQDGGGFLVMEYVAGEPLSDVLARETTLPLVDVLRVIAQCAAGLHAAHVAGVVHRDVKPSNILLTPQGTAKLTDFGISLGSGQPSLTAAGMVMGTAQYLPPELTLGKKASPAADIYALGIVGYEALTGRRPYTGDNQIEIALAHVEQPLPPLPDHLPAPVRDLVEAMLTKEPAERPRSAATLARATEEVLRRLVDVPAADDPVTQPGDGVPAPDAPVTPVATPVTWPPSTPGSPTDPDDHTTTSPTPPVVRSRRELRRAEAVQVRWRRPSWRELSADRRWLGTVVAGVIIAIVLAAVLIGTLALDEGRWAGAGAHPTTGQPTD